jgi:hypothetical protein
MAVVVLGLGIVAFFGLIVAYQDCAAADFTGMKYYAEEACKTCYNAVRKLYQVTVVKTQMLSWYFSAVVALIFLLEWARPVYAKLSVFSVASTTRTLPCLPRRSAAPPSDEVGCASVGLVA